MPTRNPAHRALHAWPGTRVTELLSLRYPVVQGPFGGGLSSKELAAVVSDAGGLGSFGAHHLEPAEIGVLVDELRAATTRPFAVNLWISTHDIPEAEMTRERFEAAVSRLRPLYDELELTPPPYPGQFSATFEQQLAAVIAARPPVFSFVFGVPDEGALDACRERGIATVGTAITADEAMALDQAGVDVIVASGAEAGGHRGAFLAPAEDSLVGTLPLVRLVVDEVDAPVIAAGGIVDAQGVVSALALGADGVQVGTAFLATDQSGASAEHKQLLFSSASRNTQLTRAFSGRLARGIPNRLVDELAAAGAAEPYPYQGYLLAPVFAAARSQGRTDLVSLWCGQGAPLLSHRDSAELFEALVSGTDRLLRNLAQRKAAAG